MIDLKRVAYEIKNIGLYDFIFQDIQKTFGRADIEEGDIFHLLLENPSFLEEYKKTNIENNISNIHLGNLNSDTPSHIQVNNNLNILRRLEKYTLPFEESPTLVFIFSIEFFVLFSAQYFIVLLGLKEWQLEIYGFFGLSIIVAWIYAKKQKSLYIYNKNKFEKMYQATEEELNYLFVK